MASEADAVGELLLGEALLGAELLDSDCGWRALEGPPVGDELRDGLGDVCEDEHAEEDAEEVQAEVVTRGVKIAEGYVKPQQAEAEDHERREREVADLR